MYSNRKTILVVEDEFFISMRLVQLLDSWGYSSLTAHTGEIAIACAQSQTINLVLMDIDLGTGMDGTDTAREILKTRNVPIVFHTSYSEHEVQDRISGITHYGCIQKSVSDFELMSRVNAAIQRFEMQEPQN